MARAGRGLMMLLGLLLGGCKGGYRAHPLKLSEGASLDGKPVATETLKGQPWLIAVWMPGCGICAKELPDVEALRAELEPRGLHFLALSLSDSADDTRQAADHLKLSMPVAWTHEEMLGPNQLRSVPSVMVVDAQGRIVASASGRLSRDKLRALAQVALPEG